MTLTLVGAAAPEPSVVRYRPTYSAGIMALAVVLRVLIDGSNK